MRSCFVDRLGARLWTPCCVLCGIGVFARDATQDICAHCLGDLPWLFNNCEGCGVPLPIASVENRPAAYEQGAADSAIVSASARLQRSEHNAHLPPHSGVARLGMPEATSHPRAALLCAACLAKPMFDGCVMACEYVYPVNLLLQALKFRRRKALARVLAYMLSLSLRQAFAEPGQAGQHGIASRLAVTQPELIVPVPLHRNRLVMRGYNQAAEIALCLPLAYRQRLAFNLVKRHCPTQQQTGLSKAARAANLSAAFALRRGAQQRVVGKHIALLDDVVTTGATMRALAHLFAAAGAASVQVWAVARTP